MTQSKEVILRGLPISKGIGIGSPVFLSSLEGPAPILADAVYCVDAEVERYQQALQKSRADIQRLQTISLQEGFPEIIAILETHLEIMQDPMITTQMEDRIRLKEQTTETIFYDLIEEYKNKFTTLKDNYFKERVRDIIDISQRILSHLRMYSKPRIEELPHHSVVLTHELVPSETIEASGDRVSAFVTAAGGLTSHAAIIARAKGIPYVANVDIKTIHEFPFSSVIVDGSKGFVILNPTTETLQKYTALKESEDQTYQHLTHASYLKAETIDGYEIQVFANLENPLDIDLVTQHGAAGVGLFRSEYLFLSQKKFPSEEDQFSIYKNMAQTLDGKPLVVRIFDLGGDKKVELKPHDPDVRYFEELLQEQNPALGCRAVRFLLKYPELLRIQLKAIVRASHYGEIHIVIPMVSDISEFREVKHILKEVCEELTQQGIKIADYIPLGCMIEVPSSVIMCDILVKEADFLSIGTNDLVQYVMAADRSNPNTSELYFSMHPSILRLIRSVISSANLEHRSIILCGEYAADPEILPILIGLGIREISVATRHIPIVKHTIRQWKIIEACRFAEGALEYGSAQELKEFLSQERNH